VELVKGRKCIALALNVISIICTQNPPCCDHRDCTSLTPRTSHPRPEQRRSMYPQCFPFVEHTHTTVTSNSPWRSSYQSSVPDSVPGVVLDFDIPPTFYTVLSNPLCQTALIISTTTVQNAILITSLNHHTIILLMKFRICMAIKRNKRRMPTVMMAGDLWARLAAVLR
jgi:hypothetical protein